MHEEMREERVRGEIKKIKTTGEIQNRAREKVNKTNVPEVGDTRELIVRIHGKNERMNY